MGWTWEAFEFKGATGIARANRVPGPSPPSPTARPTPSRPRCRCWSAACPPPRRRSWRWASRPLVALAVGRRRNTCGCFRSPRLPWLRHRQPRPAPEAISTVQLALRLSEYAGSLVVPPASPSKARIDDGGAQIAIAVANLLRSLHVRPGERTTETAVAVDDGSLHQFQVAVHDRRAHHVLIEVVVVAGRER